MKKILALLGLIPALAFGQGPILRQSFTTNSDPAAKLIVTNIAAYQAYLATNGLVFGGGGSNSTFYPGQSTTWRTVGGSNVVDVVGTLTNNTTGSAYSALALTNIGAVIYYDDDIARWIVGNGDDIIARKVWSTEGFIGEGTYLTNVPPDIAIAGTGISIVTNTLASGAKTYTITASGTNSATVTNVYAGAASGRITVQTNAATDWTFDVPTSLTNSAYTSATNFARNGDNVVTGEVMAAKSLSNSIAGSSVRYDSGDARWYVDNGDGFSSTSFWIGGNMVDAWSDVTNYFTLAGTTYTNNTGLPGVVVGSGIGTNLSALATTSQLASATNAATITASVNATNATNIRLITAQQTNDLWAALRFGVKTNAGVLLGSGVTNLAFVGGANTTVTGAVANGSVTIGISSSAAGGSGFVNPAETDLNMAEYSLTNLEHIYFTGSPVSHDMFNVSSIKMRDSAGGLESGDAASVIVFIDEDEAALRAGYGGATIAYQVGAGGKHVFIGEVEVPGMNVAYGVITNAGQVYAAGFNSTGAVQVASADLGAIVGKINSGAVTNAAGSRVAYLSDVGGAVYDGSTLTNLPGALNVMDFGAIGDGSTDNTSSIQAALNAGAGGQVFIPHATNVYRVNGTLLIPPNTWLRGEVGMVDVGTRIYHSSVNTPVIALNGGKIRISDLSLYGLGTGNGAGIATSYTNITTGNFTIERVGISDFATGIILNYAWTGTLQDNNISGCGIGLILSNNVNAINISGGRIGSCTTNAIFIDGASCLANTIQNLTIEQNAAGIRMTNSWTSNKYPSHQMAFRDLYYEYNTNYDLWLGGSSTYPANGITVDGNSFSWINAGKTNVILQYANGVNFVNNSASLTNNQLLNADSTVTGLVISGNNHSGSIVDGSANSITAQTNLVIKSAGVANVTIGAAAQTGSTNNLEIVSGGAKTFQVGTNGTTYAVNLDVSGSVNYSTNSGSAVSPNMAVSYALLSTNAAFAMLLPANVDTTQTKVQTSVLMVTNTTAAMVAITAPAAPVKSTGTWNVTNVSAITFTVYPKVVTNAICLPIF